MSSVDPSRPGDEFGTSLPGLGGIRVYHRTADNNGDRRKIAVFIPADTCASAERFIRNDPSRTFLSSHHFWLNTVIQGIRVFRDAGYTGIEPMSRIFEHQMEAETALARVESRRKTTNTWSEALQRSRTPTERTEILRQIQTQAEYWDGTDPLIASELRHLS